MAEVSIRSHTGEWAAGSVCISTSGGDGYASAPLISGGFTQIALAGRFPAYEGALEVRGLLAATRSSTELAVAAIATGLEADEEGLWHFHRGFNCDGGSRRTRNARGLSRAVGCWR